MSDKYKEDLEMIDLDQTGALPPEEKLPKEVTMDTQLLTDVSAEISFSATQALQNGWSKSNTESKTYTNGTSNTRTVPPYSAAVMETGSSDIEVTTRYNCPGRPFFGRSTAR